MSHSWVRPFKLNLQRNSLRRLYSNGFLHLGNAVSINLGNNALQDIRVGAFHGLAKLRRLYLHENKLEVFRNDTFAGLEALEYLQVSLRRNQQVEHRAGSWRRACASSAAFCDIVVRLSHRMGDVFATFSVSPAGRLQRDQKDRQRRSEVPLQTPGSHSQRQPHPRPACSSLQVTSRFMTAELFTYCMRLLIWRRFIVRHNYPVSAAAELCFLRPTVSYHKGQIAAEIKSRFSSALGL